MPFEERGLSQEQVKEALSEFGHNALPEKPPPTDFQIFFSQLKSPLVYILVLAGVVTLVLSDYKDSSIIFLAVFINTIFGFLQERRANAALAALKKLIHPTATVIRDGVISAIKAQFIVPGDILILKQGDKVPADGVLLHANRLFVNESVLTGESLPLQKNQKQQAFMGTVVTAGQGLLQVTATGGNTQMGKIAQSVQDFSFDTPLRRQLSQFSNQLVFVVIGLTLFVVALGVIRGRDFIDIFTTSVALAVSAIPEGLLVALTVVLAIGMQRILARRGLVRNLVSAETLGGVTTICTDKTGTLTQGKMQVVETVGEVDELAKHVLVSNDLDDPMVVAAYEWAQKEVEDHKELITNHKRIDSIPFSSEDRFFASLNRKDKNHNVLYVSGAPEYLLGWSDLSATEKKKFLAEVTSLTGSGKRLIAFAQKKFNKSKTKIDSDDMKSGLQFIGMLGFSDPVRPGVEVSLQKARNAGIKIMVITGDYPQTAVHVMNELGLEIDSKNIIVGKELAKLSTHELSSILKNRGTEIVLFARTTPDQKLKIVESLRMQGEVVAMMGDGVNDAPALSKADVGIVVGDATDVAKEASDLVLLDSSFETIVAAVEEGRGIFDNIRRVILYLMSGAFAEIVAVVVSLVFALPLPVTAAQILWINIVSDGFPNIALTVDPKRGDSMSQPPRSSKELLVTSWMKRLILIISTTGGLLTMALFIYTLQTTTDALLARSVAFAALGISSLIYVFSVRNLEDPIWKGSILRNRWLLVAVAGGIFLQVLPYIWPALGNYFEVVRLEPKFWLLIFAVAFIQLCLVEVSKVVFRWRHY